MLATSSLRVDQKKADFRFSATSEIEPTRTISYAHSALIGEVFWAGFNVTSVQLVYSAQHMEATAAADFNPDENLTDVLSRIESGYFDPSLVALAAKTFADSNEPDDKDDWARTLAADVGGLTD